MNGEVSEKACAEAQRRAAKAPVVEKCIISCFLFVFLLSLSLAASTWKADDDSDLVLWVGGMINAECLTFNASMSRWVM